jgi:hypothetical protein
VAIDVNSIGTRDGLLDTTGDWARLREVDTTGAVLVRPDRHVAWRAASIGRDSARELTRRSGGSSAHRPNRRLGSRPRRGHGHEPRPGTPTNRVEFRQNDTIVLRLNR